MNLFEKINQYTNDYNLCGNQFLQLVKDLTSFHFYNCDEYQSILIKIFGMNLDTKQINNLNQIPYIHVDLFKNYHWIL